MSLSSTRGSRRLSLSVVRPLVPLLCVSFCPFVFSFEVFRRSLYRLKFEPELLNPFPLPRPDGLRSFFVKVTIENQLYEKGVI